MGRGPEADLFDSPYRHSEELIEGTLVKAQREYESKKHPHLGYLMIDLLFDKSANLADGFHLLELAERLTYEQCVLLALFWNRTTQPEESRIAIANKRFGEMSLSGAQTAILLALNELFALGVVTELEEENKSRPRIGSLAARFGGASIAFAKPTDIRISGAGEILVRRLGLTSVPDDELLRVADRLSDSLS